MRDPFEKLTSPGPALYWQTRLGRHGRIYRMCKLRSMFHECELIVVALYGPV